MSPEKLQTVAFLGQDPVRRKIVVDNKCLQQVKNFEYFGFEILYKYGEDIQQKLATFSHILGIVNNTCKRNSKQRL
jgi:hypothetical protein